MLMKHGRGPTSGQITPWMRMARNRALSWAAKWIENSAKLNGNPAVVEFAANMAMTIRSQMKSDATESRIKEDKHG